MSKSVYDYTRGTLGTPIDTITYTYDSTWKDLLTSYDGKSITYDTIGNPLSYDGTTFTWQKGRQLATISNADYDLEFRYNSDGLRTRKISDDKTIEYYYSGDALVAQYDGTNWMKFVYSADGEMIGFIYDDAIYYYIKNVQGDVMAIANEIGNFVAYYMYDAWGNVTPCDDTYEPTTAANNIAVINPIRYRGYYYDSETGLYYLQSRYYNPEWGRFINADGYASTGQGLTGSNMFAYCGNNPIMYSDPTGTCLHNGFLLGPNCTVCSFSNSPIWIIQPPSNNPVSVVSRDYKPPYKSNTSSSVDISDTPTRTNWVETACSYVENSFENAVVSDVDMYLNMSLSTLKTISPLSTGSNALTQSLVMLSEKAGIATTVVYGLNILWDCELYKNDTKKLVTAVTIETVSLVATFAAGYIIANVFTGGAVAYLTFGASVVIGVYKGYTEELLLD